MMDWCAINSDADFVLVCCGEEKTECESEALNFVINPFLPSPWPQGLSSDQKNEIAYRSSRNELSLKDFLA